MKLFKFALMATALFNCSVSLTNAQAATLTESPANVAQGGTVTATWSAIAAPTTRDWIGLYASGAVDTTFLDWIYVSCSKSAGAAIANGSCPFSIPSSLTNGTYELRLLTNNGYTRLAASNPFNVGPLPPRFVDNGDGTITDDQTGLMWEKKTGIVGAPVFCDFPTPCPDPHNVNNRYTWTTTPLNRNPDGTVFTNFLARINTEISFSANGSTITDVCFAGHCDWRLPNVVELRTIIDLSRAGCGGGTPCIDPIFEPTVVAEGYFSSTKGPGPGTIGVWHVLFDSGGFTTAGGGLFLARAVRGAR